MLRTSPENVAAAAADREAKRRELEKQLRGGRRRAQVTRVGRRAPRTIGGVRVLVAQADVRGPEGDARRGRPAPRPARRPVGRRARQRRGRPRRAARGGQPGAVERGVKAGAIVKAAAQVVGGGGGGRDTLAQAGGKDASKLPEALETARAEIAEALGVLDRRAGCVWPVATGRRREKAAVSGSESRSPWRSLRSRARVAQAANARYGRVCPARGTSLGRGVRRPLRGVRARRPDLAGCPAPGATFHGPHPARALDPLPSMPAVRVPAPSTRLRHGAAFEPPAPQHRLPASRDTAASSPSTTAPPAAASPSPTPRARSRRRWSRPAPEHAQGLQPAARRDPGAEPATVVVGLPLSLSGRDSAQTREARAFAERLERDARTCPWSCTTSASRPRWRSSGPGAAAEDSRAAAVLLEDWLAARG